MAEKILQTRIINKHADLAAWKDSTLALKTGEIALARVETTKPDGNGGFYKVPTYLMKVGDGEKTFSQLEWLAAPASDVYEWAKAATKPGYTATEIARGASNVATDLGLIEQDIVDLKTAIGSNGSVAQAIEAAINALDENTWAAEDGIKFVTAVGETDGKISVTRRALTADDIPALGIDKITGLQAALDLKAAKTYVDQQDNAISARLNEGGDVYVSIADAKKAGTDAQSYAEGVNTTLTTYKTDNDARVKAIENDYTTAAQAGTIAQGKVDTFNTTVVAPLTERVTNAETAISNLKGGETTATVKGNAEAIADLEQRIGDVANVMNFRGVSSGATPGADITNPKAGDVIIYGEAEYVYDETGKWVKFGDASDNAAAISELQGRVNNVENDLKDGGATYAKIVAAQAQADKGVQDAATAQAKADANETAIGVINGTGEGSIAKALADAKAYADTAESDAVTAANSYTDGEIDKVEQSLGELTTVVGTNKTEAAEATKKVADDLAAEISRATAAEKAAAALGQKGIDDAAAALQYAKDLEAGQVKTNKENIAALDADITTIENNYARVSGSKLVYGQGDAEMTIIFDCGGVE